MDIYWIWLSKLNGLGPIISKKLLKIFESPINIYNASKEDLLNTQMLNIKQFETIIDSKSMEKELKILEECRKKDIKLLTYDNSLYPCKAKHLPKSPILLYYRGTILKNSIGIGIVGSRRCTEYGKQVSIEASEFFARNNVPIISGMAKGIDSYAHTACLNSGGYTLAFLGNGVDICYPKEHIKLMERIIEKGAVISQYSPQTPPTPYNFPERNYTLTTWCEKLLVVEASEKSGALTTAAFAKNNGIDVYVAPNSIYIKEAKGSNKLIQEGANLYIKPEQLTKPEKHTVDNYRNKTSNKDNLSTLEKQIIKLIKKEPRTLEIIVLSMKGIQQNIIETISMMELDGKIKLCSGNIYRMVE